jgi:hypothetical protein
MNAKSKALAIGCAAALAGMMAPATASATGVCYAFTDPQPTLETVDGGPPVVLRYLPTKVGSLTTDLESRTFAHLKQEAFSIVGKATAILARCAQENVQQCPSVSEQDYQTRLMTTVDGSIITGRLLTTGSYSPDAPGAHMGVNVHILRRIENVAGPYPIGPATLECTSDQVSATPNYWRCNLRADISVPYALVVPLFQPIILRKVVPSQTPACSVFQDGEPEIREPV